MVKNQVDPAHSNTKIRRRLQQDIRNVNKYNQLRWKIPQFDIL